MTEYGALLAWMKIGDISSLLSYTEVPEDVAQDIVSGDVTGDGGQVMYALAYVLAQEIA